MRSVVVVLAVVGLLVAGCGGGGGNGGSTTSGALSKSEYVTQITAILSTFDSAVTTIEASPTAAKIATALTTVQAGLKTALPTLKAMQPPAEVAPIHTRLITAVTEVIDELGPAIAKLKAGGAGGLSLILQLKGVRDIEAVATQFGKAGYKISLETPTSEAEALEHRLVAPPLR